MPEKINSSANSPEKPAITPEPVLDFEELATLAADGDTSAIEQIIKALRSPSPEDAISAVSYGAEGKLSGNSEIRAALLDAYKRKLQKLQQSNKSLVEPESRSIAPNIEPPEELAVELLEPEPMVTGNAGELAQEASVGKDERTRAEAKEALLATINSPFPEAAVVAVISAESEELLNDRDIRAAIIGYLQERSRDKYGNYQSQTWYLVDKFGFSAEECEPLFKTALATHAWGKDYLAEIMTKLPLPAPEKLKEIGLELLTDNLERGNLRTNAAIRQATGITAEDCHAPQFQALAQKLVLSNINKAYYDDGLQETYGLSEDFFQSPEVMAALKESLTAALDTKTIHNTMPPLLNFAKKHQIALDTPDIKKLVFPNIIKKLSFGEFSDYQRIVQSPEFGISPQEAEAAVIESCNQNILWGDYYDTAKSRLEKFNIPVSVVMPAVNQAMAVAMSSENAKNMDKLVATFGLRLEDYQEAAKKMAIKKLSHGDVDDYYKITRNFKIDRDSIAPDTMKQALETGLQTSLSNEISIINNVPDQFLNLLKKPDDKDAALLSEQDRLAAKDKLLNFLASFDAHAKINSRATPEEYVRLASELAKKLNITTQDLANADIARLKQLAGEMSATNAILELPRLQQTFDLPDTYDTPLIKKNAEDQLRKELTREYSDNREVRYAQSLCGLMDPADRENIKKNGPIQRRIEQLIASLLGDYSYNTGNQEQALYFRPIASDKTLRNELLHKRALNAFSHLLGRSAPAKAKELAEMFSIDRAKTDELVDIKIKDYLIHGQLQSFQNLIKSFPRDKETLSRAVHSGLKEYVKFNDNINADFVQKIIDCLGDEEQAKQLKAEVLAENLTSIASYTFDNDITKADKKENLDKLITSFQNIEDKLKPDQAATIRALADAIPTDYRLCSSQNGSRYGGRRNSATIENEEVQEIFRQASKMAITEALNKEDANLAGVIYLNFKPAAKDLENAIYQALENTKTTGGLSPLIAVLRRSSIEAFIQAAEAAIARTLEDSDILEFLEKDLIKLISEGQTGEANQLMRTYSLRLDSLKTPGLQQALFKGLAAQIRQPGGLGDDWLMDMALPGSKPEDAFAFAQSEFGPFIAQIEAAQPKLIEQAKKSPVLLFGLLAYENKADKFIAEIDKNQFFGEALENNPRFGPLLMAKYPKLDKLSKDNIVELFRHKAHILKDYPELDPNSTEFRLDMQEALKDYRRNAEIIKACRDAGVDMDGWLDFDQESRFALGKEKEYNYASQTQPPVERLEKTMGNYTALAHQALADYKPELEQAHAASPESQALTEKIDQQKKLLAFEQEKPEEERNQNKIIGINKGLEALLKRQSELKPVTVWQKISGEVSRSKVAFADTLITQKELASVEDKIRKTNKAVIIEEDINQLEKLKAKLESQIRKCREIFEGFENKLRDLLTPALGETTEALLQSLQEAATEDLDHYQSDIKQLDEFFNQQNNRDSLEGRPMRIAIASRNPDVDLYLGNYTNCCIRIDSSFHGSESPISDYITDLGMHNVVIIDEETKAPIVAAWCFIGRDEHYDKILVVDNIEANTSYTAKHRAQLEIKLDDYLEKLAAASDIRMIYQGTDNNDLYTKRRITHVSNKVGGYNRASGYYLEAEQDRGHNEDEDDDDENDFEDDDDEEVEWDEDENDNEDWNNDDGDDDENDENDFDDQDDD
ncbi:MAG: hypothetical protein WCO55_01550 [Candidatus Falkowbacteria bacterium]